MTAPTQLAMNLSGPERRDRGMASAISHHAFAAIMTAIDLVASERAEFTSEDVVDRLPQGVRSQVETAPNTLGAAIRAAAKGNRIAATGNFVRARHDKARGRSIRTWKRA